MLDRANDPAAPPQIEADTKSRPVEFRGGGFTPRAGRYSGWIALLLTIGFWQLAGSAGWVNPLFLPAPSAIAGGNLQARAFRRALASSVGFGHAHRNGLDSRHGCRRLSSAFRSGSQVWRAASASPSSRRCFPIPKIALLPLLILWLGIGEEPKIATIALGVFFSTAISVYSGVDNVPRNLIRMAQSFNVPFHSIVRRVIWPGALPSILAGFRITASVALLLVVSAEMIGAEYGIGAFVLQAGNLMQTDQLLAGVVILSLFGLAVGRLINLLETRLLHWR